jgi:hypothetical protein
MSDKLQFVVVVHEARLFSEDEKFIGQQLFKWGTK